MRKIAHIINPFAAPAESEFQTIQNITFETIKTAKEFAKNQVDVQLFTAQFQEDHTIIPEYFTKLPDLKRSVLDLKEFSQKKKLPLIKDILDRLYEGTDAEYLVFTNLDIAVMPQFYKVVNDYIDKGHDAFIINRRRVPKVYSKIEDIPMMYSDLGKPHPGFDCFVFDRNLYPKFILGSICIGINFIGVALAHNVFCFSRNYRLITNKHLTIHIGVEVMPNQDKQYRTHNQQEFNRILKELKPHISAEKLPYSELPFYKKIIKWGLNPSTFILLNVELEIKGWRNKIKYLLNEIRFSWLGKD